MRKQSPTYQLQLDLFATGTRTVLKVKKSRPAERCKDSSGRYVSDIQLPSHDVFLETEKRKTESQATMIRLLTEEVMQLRAEIKKLKGHG